MAVPRTVRSVVSATWTTPDRFLLVPQLIEHLPIGRTMVCQFIKSSEIPKALVLRRDGTVSRVPWTYVKRTSSPTSSATWTTPVNSIWTTLRPPTHHLLVVTGDLPDLLRFHLAVERRMTRSTAEIRERLGSSGDCARQVGPLLLRPLEVGARQIGPSQFAVRTGSSEPRFPAGLVALRARANQ